MSKGGAGRGQGRHAKGCTCARCIEKQLLKLDKEDQAAEKNQTPPINNQTPPPAENQSTEGQSNGENQSTEGQSNGENQNNTSPPQGNVPPVGDTEIKKGVDFSKYKRTEGAGGTKTPPNNQTPPNQKKTPPVSKVAPPPMVVAINGRVLMAIVNFIAPPLFSRIAKIAKGDFMADDFKLAEKDMVDLYPAADIVAKQIFANVPPMMQLIIGYGAISWSQAMMKSSIRIAQKGEKKK